MQILCYLQQNALGNVLAADGNLYQRHRGRRDFLHDRLFGGLREARLSPVDGRADFLQGNGRVQRHIELGDDGGGALTGEGADLGDAFHGLEFHFGRLGQKTLGVLRRDAFVNDRGDDDGH